MNGVYALCFAFCLVGCWGVEMFAPFSEKIKTILEKRSLGENTWDSKRAVLGMFGRAQRNTHQRSKVGHYKREIEDHCLNATNCPSQEIAEPTGNISTGIHFGMDILETLCTSTADYLGCYDMVAEFYTCGPFSTLVAEFSRVAQDSLCQQPWRPEVLSLLQCMNNRHLQIRAYGELFKLQGIGVTYSESGIPYEQQMPILCRWVFRSFEEIMHYASSVCGGNVYSTVCEIRNGFNMMLSAFTDIDCPQETLRCTSSTGWVQHSTP